MTDRATVRLALSRGLSLFFVLAGVAHFANTDFFVAIVPPWVPAPREAVFLSGALEVAGGLAVLNARLRAAAGAGLVLLLVAVFPANVHMALNPQLFPDIPAWALWLRLPFQGVLIAWAWWATRPPRV